MVTLPVPWLIRTSAAVVLLKLDGREVYALARYRDVRSALRDPRFTSTGGLSLHPRPPELAGALPSTDGAEHARLRQVLAGHLGAQAIRAMRSQVDRYVYDLLERDGHEDDTAVHDVRVDMSHLDFIDTAGVRALVEVKARHLDRGRAVEMVNPVALVRKVVGLYGRADLLAV